MVKKTTTTDLVFYKSNDFGAFLPAVGGGCSCGWGTTAEVQPASLRPGGQTAQSTC